MSLLQSTEIMNDKDFNNLQFLFDDSSLLNSKDETLKSFDKDIPCFTILTLSLNLIDSVQLPIYNGTPV